MRLLLRLAVLAVAVSAPPRCARAQPPDPLAAADALASMVEARAATLSRADHLTVDETARAAVELDARIDALSDASAPYPLLAEVIPRMRIESGLLMHATSLGTAIDVASAADRLLHEVHEFRTRVRSLQVPGAAVLD
jgi:hypothetical protein